MEKAYLGGYAARIKYLQRAELDTQGLRIPQDEVNATLRTALDIATPLPLWLIEIRGVSRFLETDFPEEQSGYYNTKDILAGLNGLHIPIYFLVLGESRSIHLYMGTLADRDEAGAAIRAVMSSQYPGVRLWPEKDLSSIQDEKEKRRTETQWKEMKQRIQSIRSFINRCQHFGVVTGMPTPNVKGGKSGETQIDRLIHGLYGTQWALLVLAEPEADKNLVDTQLAVLNEQIQVEQDEELREWRESARRTAASYYRKLLDMKSQFLEDCQFEGGWRVQSYICAPNSSTYQRAKALIKSIFSGDYSRLERIRVLDSPSIGPKVASFSPILIERAQTPSANLPYEPQRSFKYHTLVSSGQLSAMIHLPRAEMPGYYVRTSAIFDVSSHVPANTGAIRVGEILDRGRPTGNPYKVRVQDLTKHCLLVGITGSGKTNTTFHLLKQLQQQDPKIPFLVIEPAKREYRELAKLLSQNCSLRVFTVGEEGKKAAPFRLNPFEIQPGVSVQTHIDLLKSVFNASFGMWTPLPQVLERAIHEIYRDKGWDSVHSTNSRAMIKTSTGIVWHPRAQPTLTDLYLKVEEMVPNLGYDEEITRNVSTALETRINSLRVGAKGMMLDTSLSVPIEHLLNEPTILELEGVGDDDEKAFIMGLILIALYEYYRSQKNLVDPGLRHITVIEEAHRLLTNTPMSADPEATNLRSKAVETFVNMLSEVRAYGEGFFIAEQIPTKLAPDVIKNTSLKVMHRTVANDDRDVMGGTMNLNEAQIRHVVALGTGEAVVHGGGRYSDDNAMLIEVPLAKGDKKKGQVVTDIRKQWESFKDKHGLDSTFLSYPTCKHYCGQGNPGCADTREIAENDVIEEVFASLILSLVCGSLSRDEKNLMVLLKEVFTTVKEPIQSHIVGLEENPAQTRCILTHALYRYMDKIGRQYGWEYADVDELTNQILPAILTVAINDITYVEVAKGLQSFCKTYFSKCQQDFKPFFGCDNVCDDQQCLYRYNVEPLLRDQKLDDDFRQTRPYGKDLANVCEDAARRVILLPDEKRRTAMDNKCFQTAALCFLINKTDSNPSDWPKKDRQNVIDELLEYYGRYKKP